MSVLGWVILAICFFPVWVPVLVAIFGRREPAAIRVVLAGAGILSGAYAALAFAKSEGGGGSFAAFELLFIPFRSATVSFHLAITGVSLVTALRYAAERRLFSGPGIAASLLFVGCVVTGLLFGSWFFTWPEYD